MCFTQRFRLLGCAAVLSMLSLANVAWSQTNVPPTEPGYLGVICDDRNDAGRGVRVVEVVPDSPSAQAGLKVGDRIVSIDRAAVRAMDDMGKVLSRSRPGDKLAIEVDRRDERLSVTVTLGTRPPPGQRRFDQFGRVEPNRLETLPAPQLGTTVPTGARPRLGLRTTPVSEFERQRYNLPAAQGALVVGLVVGSPAEKAQIPLQAVIVSVGARAIATPSELTAAIGQAADGATVEIGYYQQGKLEKKQVTLAKADADSGPTLGSPTRSTLPETTAPRLDGRPTPTASPADLLRQIDELKKRNEQLERRIRDLEDRLKRATGSE